jgi:DNA segregation ATPase FtsK/SpoIIIE, S-DNA-T family
MPKKNKKKEKQESIDCFSSKQIRDSILAIFVFVLALISFLSLFSLAGKLGELLDSALASIIGWSKYVFPVLLLVLALAIHKKRSFFSDKIRYLALVLFLIFIPSFLQFIFDSSASREYLVGGYIGFYSFVWLKDLLGFWGGFVVVLSTLTIACILFFNITLSQLFNFRIGLFRKISSFFEKEDYWEEDRVEEDEDDFDPHDIDHSEKEEDEILFSKKEIDEDRVINDEGDYSKKKKGPSWKTKGVKIDLPLELLSDKIGKASSGDIKGSIKAIQHSLENFGILVEMGEVNVGPSVTQYTFRPSEGIKVSRITALSNDLSLALAAHPIRIEAPIPGRSLIGVEVPNKTKAIVTLREALEDKSFKLRENNLTIALGKDVSGKNIVYDISKMPHLLVAGATNSGKSVCLNSIIISLLYQNSPDDLRFIMVDPKRVELPVFNGIPHLLTPVITEVSKTINSLRWCLNEMERRYEILNQAGKKNIQSYNKSSKEKMPYIIFIIDELADLMVAASRDIEGSIIRLTQMSRAVGIHLILATQRPSVDVITGLIKANMPARIAFSVASAIDSKTILDLSGAEKLLGQGDMLLSTADLSKPKRIQGVYVSDNEILAIVNYIKDKYGSPEYLEGIVDKQKVSGIAGVGLDGSVEDEDELFDQAKEIIVSAGKASTSFLQRRLRIGYSRAASILDMLEESGVVGPSNGSKPREILVSDKPLASSPLHKKEESQAPDDYIYPEEESSLVLEDDEPSVNDLDDDFGKYSSR